MHLPRTLAALTCLGVLGPSLRLGELDCEPPYHRFSAIFRIAQQIVLPGEA